MSASTPTREDKKSTFEKVTGHRRNRTLEKLISTSTIMAPTHDRVVGMDPDDVKTPISAPHQARTWEKQKTVEEESAAPPLPLRASTNPRGQAMNGNSAQDERPAFPSRPTDVAGYGGAEAVKTRTQEKKDHLKENMHTIIEKGKAFGNPHHRDPKSTYFRLEERVNNHLKLQFDRLCNGESTLRTRELLKFLREEQGQDIELPVDKTQMRDFGMMGERRWSYKEWLAFMCRSGALEGVRPVGKVGLVRSEEVARGVEKGEETEEERSALGYPITSYFIDSSHNTYLQGHQWFSTSTADAYKYVSTASN